MKDDFLRDAIAEGLDEHCGITGVPNEGLALLARDMRYFFEMEHEFSYQPENPLISQMDDLKRQHARNEASRDARDEETFALIKELRRENDRLRGQLYSCKCR